MTDKWNHWSLKYVNSPRHRKLQVGLVYARDEALKLGKGWIKKTWNSVSKGMDLTLWVSIKAVSRLALHSSTLAWKIPWTEEPGGLPSMRSLRVAHDWVISLSLFTFMHWRRKWQPTPVFLPGESQGQRSLVGCCLWGRTELRHDWSDLAAAAAVYCSVSPLCVHSAH